MTDLLELASRVEALTGPDREVDAEIARLTNSQGSYLADCLGWDDVGHAIMRAGPLHYTHSLDAAMTLVPDGWKLRQMNFSAPCADDRKWHLNLHGGKVGEDTFVGRGASPALALTAAALLARHAEQSDSPKHTVVKSDGIGISDNEKEAGAHCVNHPDRPVRETLDGDDLCQECCDKWARAEGDWQQYLQDQKDTTDGK